MDFSDIIWLKKPLFLRNWYRYETPTRAARVDMKAIPGTFYAKAVIKGREEPLALGPVQITNEPGRTYVIRLSATQ